MTILPESVLPPLPAELSPVGAWDTSRPGEPRHQWVYRFASGYGASVIRGAGAYATRESLPPPGEGLYELAVIRFHGPGPDHWKIITDKRAWDEEAEGFFIPAIPHFPTPLTHDVHGWVSLEQLMRLLVQIAAIPPEPVTVTTAVQVPALEEGTADDIPGLA
jgi:hypothetical protein